MKVAQQFIAGKTEKSQTSPARDGRTFLLRNAVLEERCGQFYRP